MRFPPSASLLAAAPAIQAAAPHPPGMAPLAFHKSPTQVLGIEVRNAGWEYPKGMVPAEFPGLAPKAAWRKPLLYRGTDGGARPPVRRPRSAAHRTTSTRVFGPSFSIARCLYLSG